MGTLIAICHLYRKWNNYLMLTLKKNEGFNEVTLVAKLTYAMKDQPETF